MNTLFDTNDVYKKWLDINSLYPTKQTRKYFDLLVSAFQLNRILPMSNEYFNDRTECIMPETIVDNRILYFFRSLTQDNSELNVYAYNMNCAALALYGIMPDNCTQFDSDLYKLTEKQVLRLLIHDYDDVQKDRPSTILTEKKSMNYLKKWLKFCEIDMTPTDHITERQTKENEWVIAIAYSEEANDYHFFRLADNGRWYSKRGWTHTFSVHKKIPDSGFVCNYDVGDTYRIIGKYKLSLSNEKNPQFEQLRKLIRMSNTEKGRTYANFFEQMFDKPSEK